MISSGLIQHVVGDQVGLGGERLGCGGHDPWRPIVQFVAQVDPVRDGGGHRCGILPVAGGDPDGQFGRLRPWPSPITTETASRYVRGMRSGGQSSQIQPRERASWTASWRLAAPSLAAAEER